MSIADEVRTPGQPGPATPAPPGQYADPSFDRTPPQDIAAEQSVLGGMLLSKDAIADVVEILRSGDFYRPAHAIVFDAVLDLYGRGEPADAVTVAAFLRDAGSLARMGGAAYLHTLMSSVPTAANAAYYARIVAERAVLRRLVEAGTRIVQMGFGSAVGQGRDVDDVVDLAQQAVYDVLERRVSEDFAVLADLLQPTLDEIESVGSRDGVMAGVPTGFGDLDRLLNGLHPGQLIIVAGRPGLGKALALQTELPTPDGWTTMADVVAGDLLFGADGRPTRVVATSEIMLGRDCYEVEFTDGSVVVADADHGWVTTSRVGAVAAPGFHSRTATTVLGASPTVTTRHIAATLRHPIDGRPMHAVANTRPLDLPDRSDLPLPPYVLGGRVAGRDAEGDATARVPVAYLRASIDQRRQLLAGLLDSAGTVAPGRSTQIRVTGEGFAADIRELVASLGYRCSLTGGGSARRGRVLTFSTPLRPQSRSIVDVRRVPSVPVRCVSVDSTDHLFLAGAGMVPTHNSTVAMDFARSASVRHNMSSAIFSLEMSKIEIVTRLLAAEARVPLHVLRSGLLSDDDWTRLARRMGEISEAPVFVDDTPNMTLMEIRAKSRRLRQRHDLRLVIVDYLQLMTSPKRVESRQQEVADLSRGLKLLAKEIECPVIAVSQLNRGPEQRTDKRPQLADLRESGCLAGGTRLVRADTNQEVTLAELVANGVTDIPLWALDERLRYVPRTMTRAFSSGVKPVYRMRLASGRQIDATARHKFLTIDGWTPLEQLAVGSPIAVPGHIPAPVKPRPLPDDEIVLLARALGDGSFADEVPDPIFSLPTGQVALYLKHAWAAHGSVAMASAEPGGRISFGPSSRRVADGVASLLLRLGITFRTRCLPDPEHGGQYTLDIMGRDDQVRFMRRVGADGGQTSAHRRPEAALTDVGSGSLVDTVPREIWTRVRAALTAPPPTRHQPGGVAVISARPGHHVSGRHRLARVAAVLDSVELDLHATNDVLWDEVAAIDDLGPREVYDATVPGLHNFIADGVAAHNSIEQDADVVILLHRDDYYDRESPRAGEADFIVAKHRNGPTSTVTVAAQLHFSRFVDMAVT